MLGLLAAIVLAGLLAGAFNREPLYKDKPVRWWVDQACNRPNAFDEQRAVKEIGPEAIPFLIAKLRIGNTWLWKAWIGIHPNLPGPIRRKFPLPPQTVFIHASAAKPAVPDLIRLLDGKNQIEVDGAAIVLRAIGPEARVALPALREALATQSSLTQVNIANAISKVDHDTNLILTFCRRAIAQSADEGEAGNAASLLQELGPAAGPVMPLLIEVLREPKRKPGTRGNVAYALAAIGKTNEVVMNTLLAGLKDSEPTVRVCSAGALWRLDPSLAPLAAPVIVAWIADPNRERPKSKSTLARFASADHADLSAARAKLVELSQSGSPDVRGIAAEALQSIDAQPATNHLGR